MQVTNFMKYTPYTSFSHTKQATARMELILLKKMEVTIKGNRKSSGRRKS